MHVRRPYLGLIALTQHAIQSANLFSVCYIIVLGWRQIASGQSEKAASACAPEKSNFPGGAAALFSHSAWQQRGVRLKNFHRKNCTLLIGATNRPCCWSEGVLDVSTLKSLQNKNKFDDYPIFTLVIRFCDLTRQTVLILSFKYLFKVSDLILRICLFISLNHYLN